MSGGWEGSNRRERLPVDWEQRKAVVHRRSRGVCEVIKSNGQRCGNPANGGVDHVIPNDDHSPSNLRDTCHFHHSKKSSQEGNAEKARRRALRFNPPEEHPGRRQR